MKVGIGYAAYISNASLFAFARETLNSIKSADHELLFCGVANYVPNRKYLGFLESKGKVLANPENNVSMAWNRSIRYLLDAGCDYVLVPNLDILFKPDLVDNMVRFAAAHKEFILWTALPWDDQATLDNAEERDSWAESPHFSCFMVDDRLLSEVGEFDTNFKPAYNEDLDMHWRIVLAGQKAVGYEGARFYHYGSAAIRNDLRLRTENFETHRANNEYFIRKWGYKPATAADPFLTAQMYKVPFDGKSV